MKLRTYLLPVLSAALIAACGGSDNTSSTNTGATTPLASETAPTIDQVAGTGGFTALLAAAAKAGLGTALADPAARLTVFAPTDNAFNQLAARLGFASAGALVEALPPATLKHILSYHLLPASKQAADLGATAQSTQPTLYQFDGQPASIALDSGQSALTITDATLATARVTAADIAARNGVIHAIDRVLVPPGVLNIVQMAQLNPQLSSLVGAVTSAGLKETLSGPGPFTVFAPTDEAFAAAPSGLGSAQLATVLGYHVLGAAVPASEIPFGMAIGTLASQQIVINAGTPPTVTDTTAVPARIVATDVRASNGVVHVIDKVLIPAL